ncbi:MAG: Formylmethionine deformylase [uncultured bacterium]|uniref:Peptide deformylase n=1 Tax=Candidatus Gottesmanbacteria bacterium RIFCSPLOWO2_01_FULL_43_11b TaxID=1798392 RepID=A0A1F6AGD7_9BACT|nr:MAG: Formylmethionine deformylase [uncultured bacterium]OGG23818.1 MAG: peptide deformylase [Candidatus Gottesmanbacteria bacterium RIFCSPLOWO2_01_FULL_43_11b]
MKPIVHVPNAVLTTPSKTVTSFDKRLAQLISDMKKILLGASNPKGVGLAAPQIGENWRIFITKPWERSRIRVFINPEIIKSSIERTDGVPGRDNKFEGCLSILKIWGKVKRIATISLRYYDQKGQKHEEEFKGFLATIIQHETDHTNGILFTQRVLEQKGKLYQTDKDKEGKEILEEISI